VDGRSDLALMTTVLAAAALVLAAPVLGRIGYAGAADLAMAGAAACGVASFTLAGVTTWRAARRRRDPASRTSGECP
jgi:hypothetical protein